LKFLQDLKFLELTLEDLNRGYETVALTGFRQALHASHDVEMQHRQPKHEVPDKVASQPSVRREPAGFSSSLHGDWRRRAAAAR
jgi:hypothetical protein